MIIVSGRITTKAGKRDAFLKGSQGAVVAARKAEGCRDFSVSADLVEPDRVNVYEEWQSAKAMLVFRGDGPGDDLSALIESAEVRRHSIRKSGPA
jgi:quinol monooxygenase YgiN